MSTRIMTRPKLTGLLGVVVGECGSVALAATFPVAAIIMIGSFLIPFAQAQQAPTSQTMPTVITCNSAKVNDRSARPTPLRVLRYCGRRVKPTAC